MNTETNEFVDEWFEVSGERIFFDGLREVDFAVLLELALEEAAQQQKNRAQIDDHARHVLGPFQSGR